MKHHQTKKDSYAKYDRHPERDWAILVTCATILLLVVLAGSAYLYNGIYNGKLFIKSTAETNPSAVLNSQNLHALVETYDARATQFSALQKNDPKVVDPSL